jgi:hypothetical protein
MRHSVVRASRSSRVALTLTGPGARAAAANSRSVVMIGWVGWMLLAAARSAVSRNARARS